jgi:hypothetical protein
VKKGKKIAALALAALAVWWVVDSPDAAAGAVQGGLSVLQDAGESGVTFLSDVAGG